MTKTTNPTKPSLEYESNPFKLSFRQFNRFFTLNVGWAIALIILGTFGSLGQLGMDIGNKAATEPAATTGSSSLLSQADPAQTVAVIIFIASGVLLLILGAVFFGTYVQGMLAYVALRNQAGKTAGLAEACTATNAKLWRLLKVQLLALVKILGWSLLFIIPGIIASLRYQLLPYVVMDSGDSDTKPKSDHDRVKALTKGRLWEVFGVETIAGIIPFIGSILGLLGGAELYRQLQISHDKKLAKPKIHWLNYLFLVILAALIVLGLLILVAFLVIKSS